MERQLLMNEYPILKNSSAVLAKAGLGFYMEDLPEDGRLLLHKFSTQMNIMAAMLPAQTRLILEPTVLLIYIKMKTLITLGQNTVK